MDFKRRPLGLPPVEQPQDPGFWDILMRNIRNQAAADNTYNQIGQGIKDRMDPQAAEDLKKVFGPKR